MPTRLMLSTPPPIAISFWPDITCAAARFTASRPGGAEAVDLHARHLLAVAGLERDGAGDVGAGLADRIDAAEDDVLDQLRIELVAVLDGAQGLRAELDRRDLVERAVGLALAARRADMIVDEGVSHSRPPGLAAARRLVLVLGRHGRA